jgi:hypothetical protein
MCLWMCQGPTQQVSTPTKRLYACRCILVPCRIRNIPYLMMRRPAKCGILPKRCGHPTSAGKSSSPRCQTQKLGESSSTPRGAQGRPAGDQSCSHGGSSGLGRRECFCGPGYHAKPARIFLLSEPASSPAACPRPALARSALPEPHARRSRLNAAIYPQICG